MMQYERSWTWLGWVMLSGDFWGSSPVLPRLEPAGCHALRDAARPAGARQVPAAPAGDAGPEVAGPLPGGEAGVLPGHGHPTASRDLQLYLRSGNDFWLKPT